MRSFFLAFNNMLGLNSVYERSYYFTRRMSYIKQGTKAVSSSPAHGEVYSIKHYAISPGTSVSSTSKTDRHDIAKILLKMTLNTM